MNSVIKYLVFIISSISFLSTYSQNEQKPQKTNNVYDRKEEILFDGKRYRKNNNYLTIGSGYQSNSIRKESQKSLGVDFQFHIFRQSFQIGLMMSGNEFTGNNNSEAHLGYGFRIEKNTYNLALFSGPVVFTGVETLIDSNGKIIPKFYDGIGIYMSLQAIKKITYDIGIGFELFIEASQLQKIMGAKLIFFFSGSYMGLKKNFNPNVRSENKK